MNRKLLRTIIISLIVLTLTPITAFAEIGPGCLWEATEDGNWKVHYGKDYLRDSWYTYKNQKYLFDSNGIMLRGWQAKDGANYYFSQGDSDGHPDGSLWVNTTTPDGHQVDANGACIGELRNAVNAKGQRANPYGKSCIEVCLGEQAIYVYVGTDLVLSSPCVTGKQTEARKTPVGTYAVYSKETNRTLKGTNENGSKYESFVRYWMPFHKGYGLHDASWRSNFGGQIYVSNGSHGCVNLPSDVAASLYNIVYVGMPVIVHD